jgi:hypothetical protein
MVADNTSSAADYFCRLEPLASNADKCRLLLATVLVVDRMR